MDFLLTIFFFILIIGFIIFVHELGHFLAAKLSGVEVKEFALGFGKSLVAKKYKGTVYKLNLIPLGGYVNLEGESDSAPNGFRNKRFRVKLFVLTAGVIMNLGTAVILFASFLQMNSYKVTLPSLAEYGFNNTVFDRSLYPIVVEELLENSRSEGQLKQKDVIVAIDDQYFQSVDEFKVALENSQNKTVDFVFIDLETYKLDSRAITLTEKNSEGAILDIKWFPVLGSGSSAAYFIEYNSTFLSGFSLTYDTFFFQIKVLGQLISNAFVTGDFNEVAQSVGGLPSVVENVGQIVELEVFRLLIFLAAVISVSLAFFNILPFPALDGGQVMVYAIEKIIGRKIPDRILNIVNISGFFILILFALLVNVKDIIQFKWLEGIWDFIRSIFGR